MKTLLSSVALAAALTSSATASAAPRANVDFAVGGATTNSANSTDTFALQDAGLAGLLALVRSSGLDIIGLTQQLDFAAATLNDVNAKRDLFWVYAGTNNYLAGGVDPSVAPAELGAALERLYSEVGARRFVVPNLPALGNLPLFAAFPQSARDGLNSLTAGHNAILGAVLAGFRASHPDTEVIPVDVFSVFMGHTSSGRYADVVHGCDQVVPAPNRPLPGACDGFLYLDIVHPASSAWEPVAQAVADALATGQVAGVSTRGSKFKKSKYVERIITLGDSFSDLGSLNDTFARGLPFPFFFPLPPFTEGRFTEGKNVIQQTEALLDTKVRSTFFAQPLKTTETVNIVGHDTLLAVKGSVIVPKQLTAEGASRGGSIELDFGDQTSCRYRATTGGVFSNPSCTCGLRAGDRIQTSGITLTADSDVAAVTIHWLHY